MIGQMTSALNLSAGTGHVKMAKPGPEGSGEAPVHAGRPGPGPALAANENALIVEDATRLAAEALARERARARRAAARALERRRWLALLLLLLVLLPGLKIFAADVVRILPGAARLYRLAGVPVAAPRLDVGLLHVRWAPTMGGRHELAITGRIVNRTGRDLVLAPVTVALLDARDRPLYRWRIGKEGRRLAAGAQARFHTRLAAVPANASGIRLQVRPVAP